MTKILCSTVLLHDRSMCQPGRVNRLTIGSDGRASIPEDLCREIAIAPSENCDDRFGLKRVASLLRQRRQELQMVLALVL